MLAMTAVVTMAFVAVVTIFAVPPIGTTSGFVIGFVVWFVCMCHGFVFSGLFFYIVFGRFVLIF